MTTSRTERTGDLEETMRGMSDGQQAQMWTALPGIITAVDLTAQTVTVQPAINGIITTPEGETESTTMPLLVDVPICWPRAGGFALTFPVAVDDECLVVFSSRCIDGWWQSGGNQDQAEQRMHDLSDGFAILAPTSQPKKLENVSSANAQLRDEVGTTFLEITPDGKINVDAKTEMNFTSPSIIFDSAWVEFKGGAVAFTSNAVFKAAAYIYGSWINLITHRHTETGGTTLVPKA